MTLLHQAAQCDSRDIAISAILTALNITDTATAAAMLCDPRDWKMMRQSERLREIANWFNAECFHCIETQCGIHVPTADQMEHTS